MINPSELFANDRQYIKLFKYLPEPIVILDITKPKDSDPRHYHEQWIDISPLTVFDGKNYFLTFVETSFLDNVNEKDKREKVHAGDINLLPMWALRIPDVSLVPPDNLLPIRRKKVPVKLEPIVESDEE